MNKQTKFDNFTLLRDHNDIAWLTLDRPDSNTNTINQAVFSEFKTILESLQHNLKPKGLVIQSGKKNGFLAGADIKQFEQFKNEEEAFALIRQGQIVLQILEDLPFPSLALIHGFCFGGGLELALACRYRIADDGLDTKLALPEVLLGIHPGWGGTIRLPRLIGSLKALDLILTGRSVSASQALKLGIIDAIQPRRHWKKAAEYYLLNKPAKHRPKGLDAISNLGFFRPMIGNWIMKQLSRKVNRMHYPAPYAVIDHFIQQGLDNQEAYLSEAKSIAQLMVSDTARNLVRVFFLKEKLKSQGQHKTQAQTETHMDAKSADKQEINKIQTVHVIGGGAMGGDIAAFAALKGFRVTLQDQNPEAIAKAIKRAFSLFQKQLKKPYLVRDAMDRLTPDKEGFGIQKADLIIEAIVEKLEAKQTLFLSLEKKAKKEAILASNTSTIPLEALSQPLQHPERLVGIHFFNPVAKMPLVEVVKGEKTNPKVIDSAIAFVRRLDKLPLIVKSAPGFLVNRVLMPYLLESMMLLEEGMPGAAIDKAAMDFGMPMGPIELADTVGLDICLDAAKNLTAKFGGKIPERVQRLVEQKHLGRKTGQGFYRYNKEGKIIKDPLDPHYRYPEDLVDRLIFRMVNEAMTCLREKIVSDADFLDAGMIFGAGFPPFRGGPLHYAEDQGKNLVLERLKLLQERYGDRFAPDPGWQTIELSSAKAIAM